MQPEIIIYTYHLGDPKMMDVFELGHKYLVYAYGKQLLASLMCGPSAGDNHRHNISLLQETG